MLAELAVPATALSGWRVGWQVGLHCELPEVPDFWVGLGDGLMSEFPLRPEVFVVSAVFGLSVEVFVVALHLGDVPVLLHHLLEVGAALGGSARGQVLCESFENLTGSA
jgi:hypothetical protein